MLLSKKIKLKVSEQDAAALEFMQGKCRGLYNWWVGRLRDGEKWPGAYSAKKSLKESKQHDPELCHVYGKLLHEVYFRLDKAMKAFYRRVKAGETPGFPRYRKRHEFFTLCYPAMYITIEGNRLMLPTGCKGDNKRFPNIVARLSEQPEQPTTDNGIIAFDLGIKTLATGVNEQGRVYHVGGFKGARWYNKQLDKIRSKRDKCKKKSKRYIHLSKVYKRVSEKKRSKQRDSLHKASHLMSHKLVASTVVVGDLSQRQMVAKQHQERNKYLNRAVFNDWGLHTFVQMLIYKCQLYGKEFHQISERDTSKTCHVCGKKQAMPLYKRTYRCENCGLIMDRDENSAQNILMRFLARLEPHTGDPVRCADVFTAIEHV